MKATSVSTAAISQSLRFSLVRAQADLTRAQKEAQTGQVSDTGLALGIRSSQAISLGRDLDRMKAITVSNGLVSSRLTATQDALKQLSDGAQSFLATLTSNATGSEIADVTRAAARSMLDTFTNVLNISFNGEHLFAGINTDVVPINDFRAPGSSAKASFDAAFQAHFGFAQTDPAAQGIGKSDMDAFLTAYEADLQGAGWGAWSNATDQAIVTRVTLTEVTETSVSANESSLRTIAMAASMVYDLADSQVGVGGREAVIEKAIAMIGQAVGAIGALQGTTGVMQKRVTDATDRLNVQLDLFERQLGSLIQVDPYEASTRVSTLLTQIETSYALTARIQQLSILRFIS
jgi:flagellar hook-associated protein 3 FlgL